MPTSTPTSAPTTAPTDEPSITPTDGNIPTGIKYAVTATATLTGFTSVEAFTINYQTAFKKALIDSFAPGLSTADIKLVISAVVRRLSGAQKRRLAAGVKVDYTIECNSPAQQTAAVTAVGDLVATPSNFTDKLNQKLADIGIIGGVIISTSLSTAQRSSGSAGFNPSTVDDGATETPALTPLPDSSGMWLGIVSLLGLMVLCLGIKGEAY
jgi:hypothetical protein